MLTPSAAHCICVCKCLPMTTCVHVCMDASQMLTFSAAQWKFLRMCLCVNVCACMYVCMCVNVCVYIRMCTIYIYIYTHGRRAYTLPMASSPAFIQVSSVYLCMHLWVCKGRTRPGIWHLLQRAHRKCPAQTVGY
jgi:hypothetical protein